MFLLYVLSRSGQVLSHSSLSFVKLFNTCIRSVTFRATVTLKHERRRFVIIWQPSLVRLVTGLGVGGAPMLNGHMAPGGGLATQRSFHYVLITFRSRSVTFQASDSLWDIDPCYAMPQVLLDTGKCSCGARYSEHESIHILYS